MSISELKFEILKFKILKIKSEIYSVMKLEYLYGSNNMKIKIGKDKFIKKLIKEGDFLAIVTFALIEIS